RDHRVGVAQRSWNRLLEIAAAERRIEVRKEQVLNRVEDDDGRASLQQRRDVVAGDQQIDPLPCNESRKNNLFVGDPADPPPWQAPAWQRFPFWLIRNPEPAGPRLRQDEDVLDLRLVRESTEGTPIEDDHRAASRPKSPPGRDQLECDTHQLAAHHQVLGKKTPMTP